MPDGVFPATRKDEPNIIAFDTAGPHISIGWASNGASGGTLTEMARGQAEALFPAIDCILRERGLAWPDIDAIGVGVGPGNFTGIRISVSAARGLGLALGLPVFAVTQFALCHGSPDIPPGTLISVAAPRGMAYVQGQGNAAPVTRLIAPEAPPEDLPPTKLVQGFKAGEIARHLGARAVETRLRPDPVVLARITRTLYENAPEFPTRPAPLYVKPPDAAPARDPAPAILP